LTSGICVYTIIPIQPVEFDPKKDEDNIRDHGVSLSLEAELLWDYSVACPDPQKHTEPRQVALVPHGTTVYFVSYQDKGVVLRMISIRKADATEYKRYAQIARNSF
jgi:uncharacterized DUF497 family protein